METSCIVHLFCMRNLSFSGLVFEGMTLSTPIDIRFACTKRTKGRLNLPNRVSFQGSGVAVRARITQSQPVAGNGCLPRTKPLQKSYKAGKLNTTHMNPHPPTTHLAQFKPIPISYPASSGPHLKTFKNSTIAGTWTPLWKSTFDHGAAGPGLDAVSSSRV